MNILLVSSDMNFASGAFNSLVYLAKELNNSGNKVTVLIRKHGSGEKLLIDNNVDYCIINSRNWIGKTFNNNKTKLKNFFKTLSLIYNIIPFFKIKKLIRERNIDIVHMNTLYTYIAAKVAIKTNTKLVWHIREFLEEDQNSKFLLQEYSKKIINKSDKIVCISQAIYNKYSKVLNKEKLTIIHNGIDIEKYYNKDKEILKNKKINLLIVGGVKKEKGQFELIEAIGKSDLKNNLDINTYLVGNCNESSKKIIQELTKKYDIKNIHIEGKKTNTSDYYKMADIVFMCSTNEAFGRVTIEGMLSGNLVIGKNCAGTKELIENKRTGLLYSDDKDLAKKIKYAIENREECQKIALQGRKFAKEHFSAEKNGKEILKEYKKIMK